MSETGNRIWGVGVELSEDHLGVLRFAACLAGPDDTLIGVHVMPDSNLLHPLVSREQTKLMREHVASDVTMLLGRAGTDGRVEVRVLESDHPELALAELAEREPLDALIIGRRAKQDDEPLVRLGEICRRVLHRLPGPVIVVPPDFGQGVGEGDDPVEIGPVVLATNFEPQCAAAARFAKLLAARLGRPLLVAHGIEGFNWAASYVAAETFEVLLQQSRSQASAKLHDWVVAQGFEDALEHVFLGDPARNLAQLVDDRRAAALVTGSRKLGLMERIFVASISSELAASTRCPTAVVPGPDKPTA